MIRASWKVVEELCARALELTRSRRRAFLDRACSEDSSLRKEVDSLLAWAERADSFLEAPALEMVRAAPELEPGAEIGPYQIVAPLGAGGMGQVYRARDTRLGRDVALKLLPAGLAREEEALKRFHREARAASALNHPGICTLHDIGEHQGLPFLVMELLDGQSLKERLGAGPLPVGQVLDLAVQISDALGAAHAKGIVHRDIKPGNLFITSSGHAKILDFGLSKLLSELQPPEESGAARSPASAGEDTVSRAGAVMGTVAYMSPEQAEGKPVDARSDVFSLGAVLYEMLAGRRPFLGTSMLETVRAILGQDPAPLRRLRPEVPKDLERTVHRCLAKSPDARYASAAELWQDLSSLQSRLARRASLRAILLRPRFAVPALLLLAAVAAGTVWLSVQNARVRWARTVALPEIARLSYEGRNCAALRLIRQVDRYLPGDPELERFRQASTTRLTFRTQPPGADVYMRDYLDAGENPAWLYVGRTPIESAVVPAGIVPCRITKAGYETVEGTSGTRTGTVASPLLEFTLVLEGTGPPGMTRVPAQQANLVSLVLAQPDRDLSLEEFWLDKYEVTNRQFKEFVDRGGYEKREYWRNAFVKEGRVISWEEAIAGFRDATGRPGPATWEFGTYPKGQADHPVSGVSWYEAAAYAEFAGKNLPTVHHWRSAAGINDLVASILQVSNFSGKGPAPVGSHRGLSPYGNYDMAGNVREWCSTPAGARRYILGGAWSDPAYAFYHPEARDPMDRSPGNGFRCAKYVAPLPQDVAGEVPPIIRDRRGDKPVGDRVFEVYRAFHRYDPKELAPAQEGLDDRHPYWRVEKVSFQAAYGNERVSAYLYLPKNARPPFQTVVYFPGAYCLDLRTRPEWEVPRFEYHIRNGRALMYPTYKGTYDRTLGGSFTVYRRQPSVWREMAIQWAQDLGRSIDYLETRPDIDRERIAFYGNSLGAIEGARLMALEPRVKAGLLFYGGCWERGWPPAEVDPFHFAPRVRAPILMLNGRHDFWFPLETSQRPLFRALGTAEEDKRHEVLDAGHGPLDEHVIREAVGWLDRYLGPVKKR